MEVNTPTVGLISFLGVNQLSLPVMTLAFGIDDIKSGDSRAVISNYLVCRLLRFDYFCGFVEDHDLKQFCRNQHYMSDE